MTNENIYIAGLGYRNPITEHEQIAWFLEQMSKQLNSKRRNAYWVNVRNSFGQKLINMQAYELLAFIKSKIPDEAYLKALERKEKAKAFREKQKEIASQQLQSEIQVRNLLTNICYN